MIPTAVLHARPDVLPKSHARAGLLANSGGEAPRTGGDRRCEAVVGRKSATTGSASVDLPMPIRLVAEVGDQLASAEELGEAVQAPERPGLDGSKWNFQVRGDLCLGEATEVGQH